MQFVPEHRDISEDGQVLTRLGDYPTIDEPAPGLDIELDDVTDGIVEIITLRQLVTGLPKGGKLRVAFINSIFTDECIRECLVLNKLPLQDEELVTIGPDTVWAHDYFIENATGQDEELRYRLLSGGRNRREIGTAYGVYIKGVKVFARLIVEIDENGIVTNVIPFPDQGKKYDYQAALQL